MQFKDMEWEGSKGQRVAMSCKRHQVSKCLPRKRVLESNFATIYFAEESIVGIHFGGE